jgi:two-component system OmpR family sensor kinase
MGVLVEDLLALARLDEVREAEHGDVDLAALARDAVDDARAAAPDREIALLVGGARAAPGNELASAPAAAAAGEAAGPGVPREAAAGQPEETAAASGAIVEGNAHQLRQVLGNLLRNALVHTPPGTPVEVIVEPSTAGAEAGLAPRFVRVTVRDHGPGLPTEDVDAIFERFWRAEGGRERGRGGAGLGLAIVAGIVDAHDGTVRAENAPGGGAAFSVTLPAR